MGATPTTTNPDDWVDPIVEQPPVDLPLGSLDDILNADDFDRATMQVPEWGISIRLRGISLAERSDAMRNAMQDGVLNPMLFSLGCLVCAVEEPAMTAEHVGALSRRAYRVMDRIIDRMWELSGLKLPDADVGKAVDVREGTFLEGPDDAPDHEGREGHGPDTA